jgi:hypothetical protein
LPGAFAPVVAFCRVAGFLAPDVAPRVDFFVSVIGLYPFSPPLSGVM